MRRVIFMLLLALVLQAFAACGSEKQKDAPPEDDPLAFYTQWDRSGPIPIAASAKVDPAALKEARRIVQDMLDNRLACRPDIRERFIQSGAWVAILAINESPLDLPEFRSRKGTFSDDGRAIESLRGFASIFQLIGVVPEEELLRGQPAALYHELAHLIEARGLTTSDENSLTATYWHAFDSGLWDDYDSPGQKVYIVKYRYEFFAYMTVIYLGLSTYRYSTQIDNGVTTPSRLKSWDPKTYEFMSTIYCPND